MVILYHMSLLFVLAIHSSLLAFSLSVKADIYRNVLHPIDYFNQVLSVEKL